MFSTKSQSRHILLVIVLSQFFSSSVWFAGNAIIEDLLGKTDAIKIGHISSAVQFGFITGTLLFALFSVGDRFHPSKVFFGSAVIASVTNLGMAYIDKSFIGLLILRFLTGFFLAGIYPIGMKIVADHYKEGLGKSLGYLVGALVLGTALPHLLKAISFGLPWQALIAGTSGMALAGGLMVRFLVPEGPHRIKTGEFKLNAIFTIFKSAEFRSVALGYFGHNWEVYAFWAFLPQLFAAYIKVHSVEEFNISLLTFTIMAFGAVGAIISGSLSTRFAPKQLATISLSISCCCCILSPLFFYLASPFLFLAAIVLWGMTAVADSPLLSKLMSHSAPNHLKATALTIANCIGFSVTIISIQLMGFLSGIVNLRYLYLFLSIGPALGLVSLITKRRKTKKAVYN